MGQVVEKGRRKTLKPVWMYAFWKLVRYEVNRLCNANYETSTYMREIYIGARENREINEVIDQAVENVLKHLEENGQRTIEKLPVRG